MLINDFLDDLMDTLIIGGSEIGGLAAALMRRTALRARDLVETWLAASKAGDGGA